MVFVLGSSADLARFIVVKTQAEALEGDIHYTFCLICTKCLPDIVPTPKLVEEVIASGKVEAWSLIQVIFQVLL